MPHIPGMTEEEVKTALLKWKSVFEQAAELDFEWEKAWEKASTDNEWVLQYITDFNELTKGVEEFYHVTHADAWKQDIATDALKQRFKKEQGLTDITDRQLSYEILWDLCMNSLPSLAKPVQEFLIYRMGFEYGEKGDEKAMEPRFNAADHPITYPAVSEMLKTQEDAFWTSLSGWGATKEYMWRYDLFGKVHKPRSKVWQTLLARIVPGFTQKTGELAVPVVQKMDASQQKTLMDGWEIVKTVLKSEKFSAFFAKLFTRENAKLKIRSVAKSVGDKMDDALTKTAVHAMNLVVEEPLALDADEETTQKFLQVGQGFEFSAEIMQWYNQVKEFWVLSRRSLEGAQAAEKVVKAAKEKKEVVQKLIKQLELKQFSDAWKTTVELLDHVETLLEGDLKTLFTNARAFITKVC